MTRMRDIKTKLADGTWKGRGKELWGGAGLRVLTEKPDDDRGDIIVVTKHAEKLSALVRDIKDAAGDWLDYGSKYAFYGKIGEAANEYLKRGDDEKELLLAVAGAAVELENFLGSRLCFAYGSNMDEKQMECRCPEAKPVGIAKLLDYRFVIDERSVASAAQEKGSVVFGLLWSITPACEESLDGYEGIKHDLYRKEFLPVEFENGMLTALVYVSNNGELTDRRDNRRPEYLEKIIAAAEAHELPESYIAEIKSWRAEADK